MTDDEMIRLCKKVLGEPVLPDPLTLPFEQLGGEARAVDRKVVGICFSGTAVGDQAARLICKAVHLRQLTLEDTELTDAGMRCLETLHQLEWLNLRAPRVTHAGLKSLGKLCNLRMLSLADLDLNAETFWHIGELQKLESLSITGGRIEEQGIRLLRSCRRLHTLCFRSLTLAGILAELHTLPNLQSLDLSGCRLTDQDLRLLAPYRRLQCLKLTGAEGLTDSALDSLAELPELEELNLTDTTISRAVIDRFQGIRPNCDVSKPNRDIIQAVNEWAAGEDEHCRELYAKVLSRPKPPLPHVKAWIERARAFIDKLAKLGGHFDSLQINVAPPASHEELDAISSSLCHPLPPPLRAFFEKGSAGFEMHYYWDLPDERREVFLNYSRGSSSVHGGEAIGPLKELVSFQVECELLALECKSGGGEEQEMWLRSVPFLRMPNADYLALDPKHDPVDPPVVYLAHDDASFPLAPNFAAFLLEWEQLCYLAPEHWILGSFFNHHTGRLETESRKACALRQLFE